MKKTLIKNAKIVNEGKVFNGDVLLAGERIQKVANNISGLKEKVKEIDASGLILIPGMIDAHVHFREPGLAHKGDLATESAAAVAGGITSFMDMPNTIPSVLTQELLEQKYQLGKERSLANFSFFMGVSKQNLEEALRTDPETICGITDDGLYFNKDQGILANYPDFIERLFSRAETLVALHCEDEAIINSNTQKFIDRIGKNIPFACHALIRSEESCLEATQRVLKIAKKHHTRFHLLHVSTDAEARLFDNKLTTGNKRITAEACVHHLWFSDSDYDALGAKIKWNPSIKSEKDRQGLLKQLDQNRLDIIATDHAPHTWKEKSGGYFEALSGGPLVQHALPTLLELYHRNALSLEKIVEKTSHHVAELYRMKARGYIREGYYGDLVLIDLDAPWQVDQSNVRYKCDWSPFSGQVFRSNITHTFVNGNLVFENGSINTAIRGKRLLFEKNR